MRKYTLASADARLTVDLRPFSDVIENAVHEAMPEAIVRVEQDCYYVHPTLDRGAAIRVGRQICKSGLSRYCIQIPKLFCSVEIDDYPKEEDYD